MGMGFGFPWSGIGGESRPWRPGESRDWNRIGVWAERELFTPQGQIIRLDF